MGGSGRRPCPLALLAPRGTRGARRYWPALEGRPSMQVTASLNPHATPAGIMEAPMVEIEKLNLWYGTKQALRDVSMSVPKHRITAFIGPSGCGKSTLLRCLNRMNDLMDGVRTTGSIRIGGIDIYDPSRRCDGTAQAGGHGLPEVESLSQVDLRERRLRTAHPGHPRTGVDLRGDRGAQPAGCGPVGRGATIDCTRVRWACPAGSSSGSASPGPSPWSRRCSSWTSPARPSIPSPPPRSKS